MVEKRPGQQPNPEGETPRIFRKAPEYADADTLRVIERQNHDDYANDLAEKNFYDTAILLPDEALPDPIEMAMSIEGQDFDSPDLDLDDYAEQIAASPAVAQEAAAWNKLVAVVNSHTSEQNETRT